MPGGTVARTAADARPAARSCHDTPETAENESARPPPGTAILALPPCRRLAHKWPTNRRNDPASAGQNRTTKNSPLTLLAQVRGLFWLAWRVKGSNLRSFRDRFTVCSL